MQQDTAARPQPVTESGTIQSRPAGIYRLDLSLTAGRDGHAINTYPTGGVDRHDEISFVIADPTTANLVFHVIREGGEKGVRPEGVRAAIHTAVNRARWEIGNRRDQQSVARLDELSRLADATMPAVERAEMDALAADMNQHLGRTFSDAVPAGTRPQVARSRTGVEHKPLSPSMRRAVDAQINGIVYPDGNTIRRSTLKALAARGYGVLHHDGQRKRIVSLELHGGAVA